MSDGKEKKDLLILIHRPGMKVNDLLQSVVIPFSNDDSFEATLPFHLNPYRAALGQGMKRHEKDHIRRARATRTENIFVNRS